MKILITGASGFVGSWLCDEALKRGMDTWAGVRQHSSRKYLQQPSLRFAVLDLADKNRLSSQLAALKEEIGSWDVVIHAGGVTKCLHAEDFDLNNYQCTRNLVECLAEASMLPTDFIYMSSLSAEGDAPTTAYGRSKLRAERWLEQFYADKREHSWLSLRPTGIYGPREKDYFMMVKSIKQHLDVRVGWSPQWLSFVYVADLVQAAFLAIGKTQKLRGRCYSIGDGKLYASRTFSDLVKRELGVFTLIRIKAPLPLLRIVCNVSEWISHITGNPSTLNRDKYNILSQRNWHCDISAAQRDLGYSPEWQLDRGVRATVKWYKENKWI